MIHTYIIVLLNTLKSHSKVGLIKGKNYQFSDCSVIGYEAYEKVCKSQQHYERNSLLRITLHLHFFSFQLFERDKVCIRKVLNTILNGLYMELQHAF
jgi:hypothetical protein